MFRMSRQHFYGVGRSIKAPRLLLSPVKVIKPVPINSANSSSSSVTSSSPFGCVKPFVTPLLSEAELAVGNASVYRSDFQVQDEEPNNDDDDKVDSSLITRLKEMQKKSGQQNGPVNTNTNNTQEGFFLPFSSPENWWVGRGAQLVLTSLHEAQFINEASRYGLVEREYLVAVELPDCIGKALQQQQKQRENEDVDGSGSAKFVNPLIRMSVERREKKMREAMIKRRLSDTPSCVDQHPFLKNERDSILLGETLRDHGEVLLSLVPLSSVQGSAADRQKRRRSLQIVSLFGAQSRVQENDSCTGDRQEGGCPSCKPSSSFNSDNCISQADELGLRHPWANTKKLLTLRPSRLLGTASTNISIEGSRGGMSTITPESGEVKFSYTLEGVGQLRQTEKKDTANVSLQPPDVALFKVQTSCATEEQIRAGFALSGLPVIGDPQYNLKFAEKLGDAFSQEQGVSTGQNVVGARKQEAEILEYYRQGCLEMVELRKGATDMESTSRNKKEMLFAGIGLTCTSIEYPSPNSGKNKAILATLQNTVGEDLQKRLHLNAGRQSSASHSSGEEKRGGGTTIFPPLKNRFDMDQIVLPAAEDLSHEEEETVLQISSSSSSSTTFSRQAQLVSGSATLLPPPVEKENLHNSTMLMSLADQEEVNVNHESQHDCDDAETSLATRQRQVSPPGFLSTISLDGGFGESRETLLELIRSDGGAFLAGHQPTESPSLAKIEDIQAKQRMERDGFRQKATTISTCPLCGQRDHTIENCPKVIQSTPNNAFLLNNKTIEAAGKSKPGLLFCILCGEYGHWYQRCRYKALAWAGKTEAHVGCVVCGQQGHSPEECPNRVPLPVSSSVSGVMVGDRRGHRSDYLPNGIHRSLWDDVVKKATTTTTQHRGNSSKATTNGFINTAARKQQQQRKSPKTRTLRTSRRSSVTFTELD